MKTKTPKTGTVIEITRAGSGYDWKCEAIDREGYIDRCCDDRNCPLWVVRDTAYSPVVHRFADMGTEEGVHGYAGAKEELIAKIDAYVQTKNELAELDDRITGEKKHLGGHFMIACDEKHISHAFGYWKATVGDVKAELTATKDHWACKNSEWRIMIKTTLYGKPSNGWIDDMEWTVKSGFNLFHVLENAQYEHFRGKKTHPLILEADIQVKGA